MRICLPKIAEPFPAAALSLLSLILTTDVRGRSYEKDVHEPGRHAKVWPCETEMI
jgi:hypothetical protein